MIATATPTIPDNHEYRILCVTDIPTGTTATSNDEWDEWATISSTEISYIIFDDFLCEYEPLLFKPTNRFEKETFKAISARHERIGCKQNPNGVVRSHINRGRFNKSKRR